MSNEVAKTPGNEIDISNFFNHEQTGFETVDKSRLEMPFLKILQKVDENDPDYIDGSKPGEFFNSITSQVYGNKLKVIVLGQYDNYVEWQPNGGGLAARYTPAEFKQAVKDGDITTDNGYQYMRHENKVQLHQNFFLYLPDYSDEGIILFSLKSTGLKHARKWISRMINKKSPMFVNVWELGSEYVKGDEGQSWYSLGKDKPNIKDLGKIDEKDITTQQNVLTNFKFVQELIKDRLDEINFEGASDLSENPFVEDAE